MCKMAENSRQGFMTPSSLLGSSYILDRNILIHKILRMPLHHQDINTSQLPTNTANTPGGNEFGEKVPQSHKNLVDSIIKGAYSSALATVVAPLRRVQLLIQCQNELLKTGRLSTPYKGTKDCFLRTIKHEGFFSLWRGNSVAVLSAGIVVFSDLGFGKPNVSSAEVALATVGNALIGYPLEYTKVRLGNDVKPSTGMWVSLDSSAKTRENNRQFRGPIDVIRKTLVSDGLGGVFRGCVCTCVGVFGISYTLHPLIQHCEKYWKELEQNQNPNQIGISSDMLVTSFGLWLAVISLPLIFYPIGTVSRRMMMTSGEANKYKGAMDALYQIVRKEGVSSLYKGAKPYIIMIYATTSATLVLPCFFPVLEIIRSS